MKELKIKRILLALYSLIIYLGTDTFISLPKDINDKEITIAMYLFMLIVIIIILLITFLITILL